MALSVKSSKLSKRTHKIIFLGDAGVGKTSLIERFANNKFEEGYNSTIGIDFIGKDVKYKGSVVRLQLWDTAGQQKYRSLIPTYLKDAVCAVLVFDVSGRTLVIAAASTLEHLEDWLALFRQHKNQRSISLICGNKNDLDKHFQKDLLEKLIEKYKIPYYTTSAKIGINIQELFQKIISMIEAEEAEKMKRIKEKYGVNERQKNDDYEFPAITSDTFARNQTNKDDFARNQTNRDDEAVEKEDEKINLNQKKEHKGTCKC